MRSSVFLELWVNVEFSVRHPSASKTGWCVVRVPPNLEPRYYPLRHFRFPSNAVWNNVWHDTIYCLLHPTISIPKNIASYCIFTGRQNFSVRSNYIAYKVVCAVVTDPHSCATPSANVIRIKLVSCYSIYFYPGFEYYVVARINGNPFGVYFSCFLRITCKGRVDAD